MINCEKEENREKAKRKVELQERKERVFREKKSKVSLYNKESEIERV